MTSVVAAGNGFLQYTYKFLLDERWLDDPGNQHRVPDGVGGLNSVLIVTKEGSPAGQQKPQSNRRPPASL